jgi:hypothetical protein
MKSGEIVTVASSAFTALSAFAFVTVYAIFAPWRKTAVGRQVMGLCVTMALVLAYAVVISFIPEGSRTPWRYARGIGVTFVGFTLLRMALQVISNQTKGRKGRHK